MAVFRVQGLGDEVVNGGTGQFVEATTCMNLNVQVVGDLAYIL